MAYIYFSMCKIEQTYINSLPCAMLIFVFKKIIPGQVQQKKISKFIRYFSVYASFLYEYTPVCLWWERRAKIKDQREHTNLVNDWKREKWRELWLQ